MPDQRPLIRVEIRDFAGLVTNIDPADLKPGSARIQENITSGLPAALEVRPGFRVVTFEDE